MPLSDVVRAFLEEPRFGVLATVNQDGTIHQSVMWFLLDGDRILMNTARGRVKATNLEQNAHISLCIEDEYRFVTVAGTATLNEDQTRAHDDIRRIGVRYVGAERIAEMFAATFSKQHRVSISLPLENIVVHGFQAGS